MTVGVVYKCTCMISEATVQVPFRRDDQDVAAWMEVVTARLAADHRSRSPLCRLTTMEYAKVPAPESAPFLGGKPQLH